MNRDIFSEESDVVHTARLLLSDDGAITRADFVTLLSAYEKLLNQTKRITNISDMLGKSLNQYKHELLGKVNVDELTNVGNRRHLLAMLERYCGECARAGTWISAIMIDIDYFKNYNDLYGHICGDACLKRVATAVSKSMRHTSDFVARYGGEEFYVVMPYTPLSGAKKVADRIMKNIATLKILHEDSHIGKYLTVSIGLTAMVPPSDMKIVTLLNACDTALYEAKSAGRNRIVIKALDVPSAAHTGTLKKGMKKEYEPKSL